MWAEAPDGRLCVGPAPDKAYVLRGQYRRKAQVLAADADTPIIPDDFHNAIVRQALLNMIDSDEGYDALAPKAAKYAQVHQALVIDQTPQVSFF